WIVAHISPRSLPPRFAGSPRSLNLLNVQRPKPPYRQSEADHAYTSVNEQHELKAAEKVCQIILSPNRVQHSEGVETPQHVLCLRQLLANRRAGLESPTDSMDRLQPSPNNQKRDGSPSVDAQYRLASLLAAYRSPDTGSPEYQEDQ